MSDLARISLSLEESLSVALREDTAHFGTGSEIVTVIVKII